jgi:tetratricopeptide (TPR) repeat protein
MMATMSPEFTLVNGHSVAARLAGMRRLLVLCILAIASIAAACLWDEDTLAVEASGKDDLVAVLAGRFERNPPLYYEMRLERSLRDLESDPTNLDLYDNAAVAAERLGHSKQAIEIILKKEAHLKPLPQDKEAWYRTYANLGTFRAHQALKETDPKARKKGLELAAEDIRAAIRINPNAHFGRELIQLQVIEWILSDPDRSLARTLWEKRVSPKDAELGLAGLIRLGSGWENIDIWSALAAALGEQKDKSLAHFAVYRVAELERAGKKGMAPLGPGSTYESLAIVDVRGGPEASIRKRNDELIRALRKRADQWSANRTAYMMERLKKGQHPDWDKTFWSDWKDQPKLDVPAPGLVERVPASTRFFLMVLAILAGVAVLAVKAFGRVTKRIRRGRRT